MRQKRLLSYGKVCNNGISGRVNIWEVCMNKFVSGAVGVVAAVGMVLMPVVGANAASRGNGTPPPVGDVAGVAVAPLMYVTTAWNMPSWSAPNVATWPQTLNQYTVTAVPDLGALDAQLAASVACGTTAQFQVDVYKSGGVTDSLLAGKTLTSPNVPAEALISGGWGVAYKVVQIVGAVCPAEVVPPVVDTSPPVEMAPAPKIAAPEVQLPTPDALAFTGPNPYAGWFAGAAGLLLAAGGLLMFASWKKSADVE